MKTCAVCQRRFLCRVSPEDTPGTPVYCSEECVDNESIELGERDSADARARSS